MINRTLILLLMLVMFLITNPYMAAEDESEEDESKPAETAEKDKEQKAAEKKKSTKIYVIKDRYGNIVGYTDTPKKDSEEIKIKKGTEYTPPDNKSVWQNAKPKEVKEAPLYTHVAIASPTNDATIRNNSGAFQVAVDVRPKLQPGHQVQLLIDGSPHGSPGSVILAASNIDRGTHSLVVQVQAADGEIIKRSDPVTIHLHRTVIKRPSNN